MYNIYVQYQRKVNDNVITIGTPLVKVINVHDDSNDNTQSRLLQ